MSWKKYRDATQDAVLRGPGNTPKELRQAVAKNEAPPELRTLVEKIHAHAYQVTDADVDALRSRYGEDELFELIVASAVGAADRRLQAALRALEGA